MGHERRCLPRRRHAKASNEKKWTGSDRRARNASCVPPPVFSGLSRFLASGERVPSLWHASTPFGSPIRWVGGERRSPNAQPSARFLFFFRRQQRLSSLPRLPLPGVSISPCPNPLASHLCSGGPCGDGPASGQPFRPAGRMRRAAAASQRLRGRRRPGARRGGVHLMWGVCVLG